MMGLGEEGSKPYFLNWGFLEQHPRVLINIFNGGRCLGYLAILTWECSPALLEQVKLAGTAIALKLQQDQQAAIPAPDYKTMFFNMLLADKQMTKSQLQEWLSYFPDPIQLPYSIVAIAQIPVREPHLRELRQSIAVFFPGVLSAVRERNLVILCQVRQLDALLHSLEARKTASPALGRQRTLPEAGRDKALLRPSHVCTFHVRGGEPAPGFLLRRDPGLHNDDPQQTLLPGKLSPPGHPETAGLRPEEQDTLFADASGLCAVSVSPIEHRKSPVHPPEHPPPPAEND